MHLGMAQSTIREVLVDNAAAMFSYDRLDEPDTSFADQILKLANVPAHKWRVVSTKGNYSSYCLLSCALGIERLVMPDNVAERIRIAWTRWGVRVARTSADDYFADDQDELQSLIRKGYRYFYSNPSNGRPPPIANWLRTLELFLRHDVYMIFDADCLFTRHTVGAMPIEYVAASPGSLITCGSFSKEWGVPSLRIGWALMDRRSARTVAAHKRSTLDLEPAFAKAVAAAMLRNRNVFLHKHALEERMRAFCAALRALGVAFIHPDTGVNVFIRSSGSSGAFKCRLLQRGVLVKEGSEFGGQHKQYVRAVISERSDVLVDAARLIAGCVDS